MSETEALKLVADLICLAARTAPKTCGIDQILVRPATEDERRRLGEEMARIAQERQLAFFLRDSANIAQSPQVILLAAKGRRCGLKGCNYCGFDGCGANEAAGGTCAFNHLDLGIAASSAAAVAGLHHADCRLMYSVGVAAQRLDLFGEAVISALGLPLSATGKNPFFDRTMPELNKK